MLRSGLVSVTFRQLTPEEIVKLVSEAGLEGIEWGGDIHVPHGDVKRAREVSRMTKDAGLSVAAYGSYYRVGRLPVGDFEKILETALALEAPTIRVWAGDRGSQDADDAWWAKVVEESREIADMAEKEGIAIAYEYHGDTLTDTNDSAYRLLNEVAHQSIRCNWQPAVGRSVESRLDGLRQILPYLANVHVFHWVSGERLPLSAGEDEWMLYLKLISEASGEHYTMLEFVKGDEPEQFLEDAKSLRIFLMQLG
jgi:3-dehydroshikimate dehydratase